MRRGKDGAQWILDSSRVESRSTPSEEIRLGLQGATGHRRIIHGDFESSEHLICASGCR